MPAVETVPAAVPVELGELMSRLGAAVAVDAYGPQAIFAGPGIDGIQAGFIAPLPDLGLLEFRGDDAVKFLHSQLTNDVEHLAPDEARWYGYCSPKGRLLSTGVGWNGDEGIELTVARTLAEPLRKRLSMYVLRAKAKVADRSGEQFLLGVGGAAVPEALAALGFPRTGPMTVTRQEGLALIGLAPVATGADGTPPVERWLLRVPLECVAEVWGALSRRLAPMSSTAWRWLEVRAAIPRIVAGTSERFVPQMVNFELVGGVDFNKGCYPGQEIVARSQYLGKLKRRMYLAHVDAPPPEPGSDVTVAGGGEPAGQVVMAAPAPGGGADLLFEAQTAVVRAGSLVAGDAPLRLEPLPYTVPA